MNKDSNQHGSCILLFFDVVDVEVKELKPLLDNDVKTYIHLTRIEKIASPPASQATEKLKDS
jgi:hypothetical protein